MNPLLRTLALAAGVCTLSATAATAAAPAPSTPVAGNAELGRSLYQARCAACHSIDHAGVGPAHRGLFGRLSGQAPGYTASDALRRAHQVWTPATVDRWLTDPEAFAPGQRMGVSVPDAQDRAHLIAYLLKATAR